MNNRFMLRNLAKKVYVKNRKEDRKIGLKIDGLMRLFYKEQNLAMAAGMQDYNKDELKNLLIEIGDLRKCDKFRNEFPSLSTFVSYLKKEEIFNKIELESLLGQ